MANLAALRAAVFSLATKNLTGGGLKSPPPAGARINSVSALAISVLSNNVCVLLTFAMNTLYLFQKLRLAS